MKIVKTTPTRNGSRVVVDLTPEERLVVVKPDSFYKLGEPMHEDVVQGFVVQGATQVHWCPIEQRWRD